MIQAQERKSRLQLMLAECVNAASSPPSATPPIGNADDARIKLLEARLTATEHALRELQAGFARVVKAVDQIEPAPEAAESEAEREATANVLAGLTKLVESMRAGQSERTAL